VTDVSPIHALLFQARKDLEHEQAMSAQAERAKEDAEEMTRRAEERADNLTNERDAWAAMARKFFGPRVKYFDPTLSYQKLCEIGDLLYDLHGQGTDVDDDTLLASLVNDWTGQ